MVDSNPPKTEFPAVTVTDEFEGPYKQVCADRPHDYSFYNKYDIDWNSLDSYACL